MPNKGMYVGNAELELWNDAVIRAHSMGISTARLLIMTYAEKYGKTLPEPMNYESDPHKYDGRRKGTKDSVKRKARK